MSSLNKIKQLAGIPVDLSKPSNAATTVRAPASKTLNEAAKVPQHRGELAPKTKDNMRARVSNMKKALEALELAREALLELPAVDYMEDIPTIIKQLHQMLHGEDGTGGVHHLHRTYKHEFDNTVFPEDIEEERRKEEEEQQALDAGITGDEAEPAKKKKTNESVTSNPAPETKVKSDGLGFEKQKVDPSKENKKPFKLAPGSDTKTMYQCPEQEKEIGEDPAERTKTDANVQESSFSLNLGSSKAPSRRPQLSGSGSDEEIKPGMVQAVKDANMKKPESKNPFSSEEEEKAKRCPDCGEFGEIRGHMGCQYPSDTSDEEDCSMSMPMEGKDNKKPKWLEKKEVKAEEKEGKKVSKEEKKKVDETSGPLFARDADHPKHNDEEKYTSWGKGTKPVNVVSDEEPSIYYPNGSKKENANQLSTNPYNENQAVKVPPAIKSSLKSEADTARKLAETFSMRRDWDSKNFHENLANAFDTLNGFLDKGTIYGIKEAQIFMTSLMSPMMNKIPADVIKYIAAGGTLRSLKSYLNDVKAPVTSPDVFQQDSSGLK